MSRSYTLEEIDRMRKAIRARIWNEAWGWYANYDGPAEPVKDFERSVPIRIEDEVRTLMAGGVSVEEVEKQYIAAGDGGKQ